LQKRGFNRLYRRANSRIFFTETLLDVDFSKPVYVLVDRLAVNAESARASGGSIEICIAKDRRSHSGIYRGRQRESRERLTFNERFECKNDARSTKSRSRGFFRSTIPTELVRAARVREYD